MSDDKWWDDGATPPAPTGAPADRPTLPQQPGPQHLSPPQMTPPPPPPVAPPPDAGVYQTAPPQAPPQYMPPAGAPPVPPAPPTMAMPGPAAPNHPIPPKGPSKKGRWGRVLAGGLAMVAVLAGAWVAYDFFFTGGGASSPEAAVTTLAEAINTQDPALLADVVNPAELPQLVDLAQQVGDAKSRLGGGGNGESVPGTETTISDLRLSTEELGPRVSRVTIRSGEFEMAADASSLPASIQGLRTDWYEEGGRWETDVSAVERDFGRDVALIVVEQDGGWYISPALTAGDILVAGDSGYEEGDFEAFGEVDDFDDGAESPEEAVDLLADAMSSGDPQEVLAVLPSDQAQFGVVFSDALEQFLSDQLQTDGGVGVLPENWFELNSFDVEEEDGPNGTKRLKIISARASANEDPEYASDRLEFRVRGLSVCNESQDSCDGLSEDTPLGRRVEEALGGSASLIVREVDNGWKIDPVASALDMASRLVAAADAEFVASATHSLDGEPAAQLEIGKATDVDFDDAGYALVSVPTKPGVPYVLQVEGPYAYDFDVYVGSQDGPQSTYDVAISDETAAALFVPDSETTMVGMGGVFNTASGATLTAHEAAIVDKGFNEEVQGTLAAPVALHRVPVGEAPASAEYAHSVLLEGSAAGGGIDLEIAGEADSGLEPGGTVDIWGSSLELPDGDSDTTQLDLDGETAVVAVWGQVGAGYAFRVSGVQRGFEGGGRSGVVSVPPGDSVVVPIDLGDDSTSFTLTVDWSESVDIDPRIEAGGETLDSESSTQLGGPVYLEGYGSGTGTVTLRNYSSTTAANVTLTFDFES